MKSNISLIPHNQVSKQQLDHFLAFEEKCFEKNLGENRKLLYFSPPFAHMVYRRDKQLVSYLRIFIRSVNWKGRSILIGGIGSVATDQAHRRRGIATQLLKKSMETLETENVDFALLQTYIPKGGKLYRRAGFYPANKGYTFYDANNKLHTVNADNVMVAPVGDQNLLKEILNSNKPLHIGKGDW